MGRIVINPGLHICRCGSEIVIKKRRIIEDEEDIAKALRETVLCPSCYLDEMFGQSIPPKTK